MRDDVYLEHDNFQKLINAESSHLIRRPGVGVSELAGSLTALVEMLSLLQEAKFDALLDLFRPMDSDVMKAIDNLNTLKRKNLGKKDFADAFSTLYKFTDENFDELEECATFGLIAASRLYTGCCALRQFLCVSKKPRWWVEQIPDAASDHKSLTKW